MCDAMRAFSERYADLAERKASEAEGERRAELLEMAERCRHVPANPPRTFMEAIQSLWTTHIALCISYGLADVFSIGRIDQYLYPYFQADLAAGRISREKAQEVIEEFHVKTATSVLPANYTLTLGGIGPDGEDATNELSYMFLEAVKRLGGLRNNVSIRVSPKTPRAVPAQGLGRAPLHGGHSVLQRRGHRQGHAGRRLYPGRRARLLDRRLRGADVDGEGLLLHGGQLHLDRQGAGDGAQRRAPLRQRGGDSGRADPCRRHVRRLRRRKAGVRDAGEVLRRDGPACRRAQGQGLRRLLPEPAAVEHNHRLP